MKHGDRIAQMIVQEVQQAELVQVQEQDLDQTSRGQCGFGSTGVN